MLQVIQQPQEEWEVIVNMVIECIECLMIIILVH